MDRPQLASRLAAVGEPERAALLAAHSAMADVDLARQLKALYFATNDSDPARAAGAAAALRSLAAVNAEAEILALAAWTSGMALLQIDGQVGAAIDRIDEAAARLTALGQEQAAAATQVSKVYALAILGRYDEAIACGLAVRAAFLERGETLAAGKIEQNLGNLYHRRDQYDQAEHFYRAAEVHFAQAGDQRLRATAENGLANVLALRHRFQGAAELYERAIARAAEAGAAVTQAEIECNLGCLALFQGRYDRALEYLNRSRRRYDQLGMRYMAALVELELADAYLELNLAVDAADIYRRIEPSLAEDGMVAEQARALVNLGRACLQIGQLGEAQVALEKARALYTAEGNEVGAAVAALVDAGRLLLAGACSDAAIAAAGGEAPLAAASAWGQLLLARWLHGEALRRAGEDAAARAALGAALAAAEDREVPQIVLRCQTSLGQIAAAAGDLAEARAAFERSVELIEALRAPIPADEFRTAFFTDKVIPYAELARLALEQGGPDCEAEALRHIERGRARALLDILGKPAVQAAPSDPGEAELAARVDAVREELNWLYSRINRLPAGAPHAAATLDALFEEVRDREQQIVRLSRQLDRHGGRALLTAPLDIARLQRELGPGTALVEYFSLDGEVLAFVVTDRKVVAARALSTEAEVESLLAQMRFQLGSLRHGAAHMAAHAERLAARTRAYLAALYDRLLKPLDAAIGERQLIVVPHRALHYVPFHALHDGERYVIERREVSYSPSAEILLRYGEQPDRPLRSAVLLSAPDERAPHVEEEVAAIAPLFPGARTLTGKQATRAQLEAAAPTADVLHLACHGEARTDNPLFSALRLADGWLTVRDASRLNLRCGLVTLSACQTGVSVVAPGDEIIGLARGFLSAGARSLLLSLWVVDDESTAAFMVSFYRALRAGSGAAAALRSAQQEMLRQRPHPYYWAPFFLLGPR